MSTSLFESRSLSVKIGEFSYHVSTRVISFFSFYLKSGYHQFDIFPDHQTFLGFSCFFFFFPVLSNIILQFFPLVLVRHHTFRPSAPDRLLSFGKLIVLKQLFLHDGCGKGESLQIAKEHSLFVQTSLSYAGFVANSTKSLREPTQSLVCLGLNWNLIFGTISITDRRVSNFIALKDKFLQFAPYVTARDCASIAVTLCSCHQSWVIWPVLRPVFFTRSKIPDLLGISVLMSGFIMIAFQKYFFWKNHIVSFNFRAILPYQAPF